MCHLNVCGFKSIISVFVPFVLPTSLCFVLLWISDMFISEPLLPCELCVQSTLLVFMPETVIFILLLYSSGQCRDLITLNFIYPLLLVVVLWSWIIILPMYLNFSRHNYCSFNSQYSFRFTCSLHHKVPFMPAFLH